MAGRSEKRSSKPKKHFHLMSGDEQELRRKKVRKALKKYAKIEPWRSYNNHEALECTVCASILSHKRSTMLDHLAGERHIRAQEEHERAL